MTFYSCFSTNPSDQRIKSDTYMVQDGWRELRRGEIVTREPIMVEVTTDWKRRTCGVEPQAGWTDGNCRGCVHEGEATK